MKRIIPYLSILLGIFVSCNKKPNISTSIPRKGVYYSLFVRSFADSNGDGTGDLQGLIQNLDYLNDGHPENGKSLGISGIWLLPVFKSHSYHGYDVDDYYSINPEYGTMEDFEELLQECKKRGISVILDIPFNHSSIFNPMFVESISADSPKHDWYLWTDPEKKQVNLSSTAFDHPVWNDSSRLKEKFSTDSAFRDTPLPEKEVYAGVFSTRMPDFNADNQQVREEFKKILSFWLKKGVSGFRFDAAGHIYDSRKLKYGDLTGQERAWQFWKELTDYVYSINPDAYMVGEVWESNGIRTSFLKGLPSVFHFDLGTKIITAVKNHNGTNNSIAKGLYNDFSAYREANPNYIDAPFLSNHDQNRFALQFKNDPDCLKLAASMYIFSEGIPFIYYGEELGMNGAKPDEQIRPPFVWNGKKEAPECSWLESKYNKMTVPESVQQKDRNSLLNYYKKIIRIKTSTPSLSEGRLTPLDTGKTSITSWTLKDDNSISFVFFNLSEEPEIIRNSSMTGGKLIFASKKGIKFKKDQLLLKGMGTAVIEVNLN